ncbi:MAG TPA: hypothetical protein DEA08_04010, partial [Planctomycetes bacterium]|nr:hypothetical protein [Planctomycetota bacterium]
TDVYGLGGILYFLLCSEAPHGPGSLANVLYSVLNKEPNWSRLENVPPALLAVLKRSMAREPSERYADAAEFAQALRRPPPVRGGSPLAKLALASLVLGALVLGGWL